MKYLISGGLGFVGTNLSQEVLRRSEELIIIDNFYRLGSYENYKWLSSYGSFKFYHCDIRDTIQIEKIIKDTKPDCIFHLAGQVAMTTSLSEPFFDFQVNILGTINILESVRKYSSDTVIIYSSTNKVYGDLEKFRYKELEKRYICEDYPKGFDETVPIEFHTPYGCSKGAADQYMLDYARIFGLKTVVFRHSSMYGGRQFATYDQGWVGWFCQKAVEIKEGILKEKITISGNGKQVRDILHIKDVINLYFNAFQNIDKISGDFFNIGGGYENSISLLELFDFLNDYLDIEINFESISPRISDQKVFIADISKIKGKINWFPKISKMEGIKEMIDWIYESIDK